MTQAQEGHTVRIHYEGRTEKEGVFDSSEGQDPLEFTLGAGQVIPGFEAAVVGMDVGDEKTVTIPAAEAYGERRDELVIELPREQFPDDITLEAGQILEITTQAGQVQRVAVAGVTEDAVQLDQNHPLAGKDLIFELELVEIVQ